MISAPCFPAWRQGSLHTKRANMCCGRANISVTFSSLQKAVCISREMITGGNRSILGHIGVGEIFGEAYVAPESGTLLNDVIAVEDSAVFFFDVKRVISTCSSACRFHTMVVQNLFFAISEKNRGLVQKLDYMSRRTTREKLLSYLSEEAKKQNSASITLPFNRQQLADYLSVDRSAMSNELCKMRDEGLLEFEKNRFRLF